MRWSFAIVLTLGCPAAMVAQAAPSQAGTVKSANADGFVLTTTAGQDVTVNVPSAAKEIGRASCRERVKAIV